MYADHRGPQGKRPTLRRCVWSLCAFVLLGAAVYAASAALEARDQKPQAHGDLTASIEARPTVTVDGVEYRRKNKITTLLVLGIDRESGTESAGFRNGGQADFILLIVLDEKAKRVIPIQIDRDTMTPITILGVLGNNAGTRRAQVSLSHGFGDGGSQSSQLTADAVSTLLLGTNIDYHLAMSMDGIPAFNDALGGITVTLQDDFSMLDPAMTKGATLTLKGSQAEYYVRGRLRIGVGTNEARQLRQQDYLKKAGDALDGKLQESGEFAGTLFDAVERYLETDMKRGRLINMAWSTRAYSRTPIRLLEGEHVVGPDGFMEFHADEKALQKLVLEIFYEPAG